MKRRTKKALIILIIMIISTLFLGAYACKKFDLHSQSLTSSEVRNINNSEITFTTGFSGVLHDYVNIMLSYDKNENIKAGLKFDIVNPKGEIVESGLLSENNTFRKSFKSKAGQWKIILHFQDNNTSAMVNFGYSVNSSKNNTMMVE